MVNTAHKSNNRRKKGEKSTIQSKLKEKKNNNQKDLFKIVRRDFTQLLIDAQTESYQETRDTESINLNKLRIEKKMSFEVCFY